MGAAKIVSVSAFLFNPHVSLFTFIGPFLFFSGLLFITPAHNLFMLIASLCMNSLDLVWAFLRLGAADTAIMAIIAAIVTSDVTSDVTADAAADMTADAVADAAIDKDLPQVKLNTRQSKDCLFYFSSLSCLLYALRYLFSVNLGNSPSATAYRPHHTFRCY
jgi:hypothetical protein